MESTPENSITRDFNPYSYAQAVWGMGADGLIYEPLLQFDLAAPPKYYPWLATSYSWSDGGKAITFTIRQGVKWSNGTQFTPADVAFTFNMLKANPSVNLNGLPISGVSTSGDTVTVTFPTPQYTSLQAIAGTAIVPKAIWDKVSNPASFTDANPVGTGPFALESFTSHGFTLKKNQYYWQAATLRVPKVYFPAYTSNTDALKALFDGQIDWTGNFIPGLQKEFVDASPATRGYWEVPGDTNALIPNLTKWPTNQLAVRQAISLAINRSLIATKGEDGLENPALNATGLTLPTFNAWASPVASMANSPMAQTTAAEKVLEQAGFTKGSDGYFEKGGKKVSITITDPSSYSDYAEDDTLIAQELRAAGIDAEYQSDSVNAWTTDVTGGDFQLTIHWGPASITPYTLYNWWLNSALATGQSAVGDFERLNDPALDGDLNKLASAATVAEQATDLVPLEKYVAQDLPVIPTTTASEWFEYNSQHYVGWPTQSDPYETGQPSGMNNSLSTGSDEVVILHLRPRRN
jgi:peptide/nickel transport system substrate-binding protein